MADLNLDVKKMPLGQLSKQQIARGFDVLEEIEKAISSGAKYLLGLYPFFPSIHTIATL